MLKFRPLFTIKEKDELEMCKFVNLKVLQSLVESNIDNINKFCIAVEKKLFRALYAATLQKVPRFKIK